MQNITGTFERAEDAERARVELGLRGWSHDDISIVRAGEARAWPDALHRNVSRGFNLGGLLGGVAGLALGLFAMLIPGPGPVVVTDTWGATLTLALGGAAIGALIGTVLGAIAALGARRNSAQGTLLAARSDEGRAPEAMDVLRRMGAARVQAGRAPWPRESRAR